MPYPKHYLFAWGGDFVSDPTEQWTNRLRLAPDDNVDLAQFISWSSSKIETKLGDFKTALQTLMSSASSGYGNNTRCRWLKLNEIDEAGHYKSKSVSHTLFLPTPFTGGGSTSMPLHVACVATFLTSKQRGPGSRGRVFIPQPSFATAAGSGRFTPTALNAALPVWATFMQAIKIVGGVTDTATEQGSPHVPAVVSNTGAAGSATTINFVQFGDVPDVMNSRRSKLVEARVTSSTFN